MHSLTWPTMSYSTSDVSNFGLSWLARVSYSYSDCHCFVKPFIPAVTLALCCCTVCHSAVWSAVLSIATINALPVNTQAEEDSCMNNRQNDIDNRQAVQCMDAILCRLMIHTRQGSVAACKCSETTVTDVLVYSLAAMQHALRVLHVHHCAFH